MDLETGFAPASKTSHNRQLISEQSDSRRSGEDRRAEDERRRPGGLFDVRARRDNSGYDRRHHERREPNRSWLFFWRRES